MPTIKIKFTLPSSINSSEDKATAIEALSQKLQQVNDKATLASQDNLSVTFAIPAPENYKEHLDTVGEACRKCVSQPNPLAKVYTLVLD